MTISNKNTTHPPLTFDNKNLEEVKHHKHLGINFEHNLSWSKHVETIVESVSKALNVLHGLMYKLDRKTLETVYLTFIRPKLEYASPIWSDITQQDNIRLEKCQLKAARIVTGAKNRTNHDRLYDEVSWEKLDVRRKHTNLKHMHKIMKTHEPQYLYELLPNTVNAHVGYNLRNKDNIREFLCRTEKFKNSFIPSTIKSWNALSEEQKNENDIDKFKSNLCPGKKCNKLFYYGERKTNVIHAQLRLKCSNLNSDLYNMHVIDSPKCPCGFDTENAQHFFFSCPLYDFERMQMLNITGQITDVTIEHFLFGNDRLTYENNITIFSAVHKFIKDSGRFEFR